MLTQNFCNYLRRSASSLRRSVCVFISCIRAQKYMPVLICMALLFSTGASAGYDNIKLKTYLLPEAHVDIEFKGQLPQSLDGFDQYTIDKIRLKIGDSKVKIPVTRHGDTSLFTSFKNYKELDKSLKQPSSLVLIWDLTLQQASSEGLKCFREHFEWWGLWWLKPPFRNCVAKVVNAFRKHQTYDLDITDALKQSVEQELTELRKLVVLEEDRLEHYLVVLPKKFFNNPEQFKERTDSILAREQSRVIFGIATYDYFMFMKETIFSETFDNLMIIKNLLENLESFSNIPDDKDYSGFTGFAYTGYRLELFKAFSSKDCKNQLSQKIIDNIKNSSRPVSAANKYAEHVCQYNLISFTEGNKSNNPKPVELNDSDTDHKNSDYQPYVFCDGLICQFNISKTHKYRLVDHHSAVSAMTNPKGMEDLYVYVHESHSYDGSNKLCSGSICVKLMHYLYLFNAAIDELKNETNSENSKSSWTFIEIHK
jgi:hypothetical protein